MLDSVYHVTLKILKNCTFRMKKSRFPTILRNVIMAVITYCYEICKPLVVYRFNFLAIYHSKMRRHAIMDITVNVQKIITLVNSADPDHSDQTALNSSSLGASADNLCKQFVPRSGLTECQS